MKSSLTILFLLISSFTLSQTRLNLFESKSEVYFKFIISEKEEINILTKIISVDNVSGNVVFAYANEKEFNDFLKLGYDYEILKSPGDVDDVRMFSSIDQPGQWDSYPTYDAYVNLIYQFESNYPSLCKIVDAGNTVQGRKILFAKISDNIYDREAEPQFMYTSSMHGDELTGYVLMLRLIDSLLSSYGTDPRITSILDNIELWINPLANPDGTYRSGNNSVSGATRYNYNNVDLNRNFPDPVYGVYSNQQQETTVFRNIQEANNFLLISNFHGGIELMNYPWDTWANYGSNSRVHADQTWYQFISRMYADTCQFYSPSGYMTAQNNGITNGGAWYVIHGGRQDYTNYYRWGREITMEISNTKLPSGAMLPNYWEYNKRSFLNYIETVLYGIKGVITDTIGQTLKAKVTVLGHDTDNSEVWSDSVSGFYLRMLAPGTYTLKFEAEEHYDTTITGIVLSSYFSSENLNVEMTPLAAVPVELSSFFVNIKGDNVLLQWTTAAEINNKGFEVQRKSIAPGEISFGLWDNIGFLPGNGTTIEPQSYSFYDEDISPGKYLYRLKQFDYDGTFKFSDLIEIIFNPILFNLEQNYPNPFNPVTEISFKLPYDAFVVLKVYDVLGNEIATLVNEDKSAGNYKVRFDGNELSSGVYFCRISAGDYSSVKKMILAK